MGKAKSDDETEARKAGGMAPELRRFCTILQGPEPSCFVQH